MISISYYKFYNFSHYNKIIKNGQYLTIGKIISINSFLNQLEKTWPIL